MQVLLVEDNLGDQRLISLAFERLAEDVELHVADDGVKALGFLRREGNYASAPRPSFVLLDLKLPHKSGLEVLRAMKQDPDLRCIPVIILTSSNASQDVSRAYDSQASAYFAKPVADFNALAGQILSWMRSAELPDPDDGPIGADRGRNGGPHPAAESARALHLASLVESAADAILSLDLEGTIQSWNPAAEALYGYTSDEAIGRNDRLIVPESRVQELQSVLEAVRTGETVRHLDTLRVDRDGREHNISLTVSPIRDSYGTVTGVAAIARDMTEQKAAEARFRVAVESSPSAMVMADADGRIVLVNAEAERMFGYSRGELIGREIEMLVPNRYAEGHPDHRADFLEQPERRRMGGGRDLFAVRQDGSEFPVEIGVNPIETPDGIVVLSAIVDITERKQAEQRFRLAVDSSPNGMVMVDHRGTIVLVNTETERMFGYSRAELVGKSVDLLVPPRFRGQHPVHRAAFHEQPAARAMGAGRDLYAIRKDGTEFPVEIGLNPIETPDGSFVLSAIADITERKQAEDELARQTEELARSNAELEQFAYVASHDLQEPLRMVASFTQLLSREYADELDDNAREYIRFAVDGAVRMQQLIRDLLTYARLSTRADPPECVRLNDAVQLALDNLRLAIEESGAAVEVGDLPTLAVVKTQFVELFQNLIGNALKFRGEDAPEVRIWSRHEREDWSIMVKDNGIGIGNEHADAVFEVFRRLHGRERYPGTGIGLALCKRIVTRHGGRIWLESEEGEGTTFFIRLPVTD